MLRVFVLLSMLVGPLVNQLAHSETIVHSPASAPRYTLELQGGLYQPKDDDWEHHYGSKRMMEMSVSLAYRFFSVLDLGTSASYGRDHGIGVLPLSQLDSGSVIYEILPIDFYAVLRARFSHNQWIVPYAGGGYTRFFYRQSIDGEGYSRGSVNALHARAGLQFLLDPLEPLSARTIYANYGVVNSYLILEGKMTRAFAGQPQIDIGGYSYRAGIMVEY